jgi:hypothetical protein
MKLKYLWPVPVAAIALVAAKLAFASADAPPANLDYSLSHLSDAGVYAVTLQPAVNPIPIGKLHGWTVAVTAADGTPVDADVVFDGGMPQHGHGLPTVPKTMGKDAEGRSIIGGVRFNMPGWWELKVHVEGDAGDDTATFNIAL